MSRVTLPAASAIVITLPARPGTAGSDEATAVRAHAKVLRARARAARKQAATLILQTDQIRRALRRQRLIPADRAERLQHSAYARLVARMESMPVIEQAKGVLMAQSGCDADEAFETLRRASQRSHIPVRDLAGQIVARTAGSPLAPPLKRIPGCS